ncbi:hypothetical protein [Croceicoccus marinus]|uniref:Uncharacterized protein n=1 Tax=Croceicoccus marinus TaxID=450378 RepID=A0A1Z1FBW0_9SPHN|nr:hypothetical protein [Croceicoccus marinus]ARU16234.1 hypothetical protein A9D14_08510 [Croceicoccus marinus]
MILPAALSLIQGAPATAAELAGGSVEREDGSVVIDILAPPTCTSREGEIVVCAETPQSGDMAAPGGEESGVSQGRWARTARLALRARRWS